MRWTELHIHTCRDHVKDLETLLLEQGALAITLQDDGDQPVYEPAPGETRLWPTLVLTGLFESDTPLDPLIALLDSLQSNGRLSGFRINALEDQAWERTCLRDFRPMQMGSRLWICPSWETPPDPAAINVILDPGLAFGTGTHPTTALCLKWLDEHISHQQEVIDYGCGSGILSIAALKLGAQHVTAVDYDIQAIESTKENASRNQIDDTQLTAQMPDRPLKNASADLIVANILAAPLVTLAPLFAKLLRPGGQLALSGLLQTQAKSVQDAYKPWFLLKQFDQRGDWIGLSGIRLSQDFPHNI